jgi:5-methylcytosine-specific restriction protein A
MPTIKLLRKKDNRVPTQKKGEYQDVYQDKRWKFITRCRKMMNPLCEECDKKKRTTPMAEVHHRVPFQWGRNEKEIDDLAFDFDNTMSVCVDCHKKLDAELKINRKRLGY